MPKKLFKNFMSLVGLGLLSGLALGSPTTNTSNPNNLIFALDVIRHGDRTPITDIPSSPYLWPEGAGQLTPTGMHQEYELGSQLRKIYVYQYHLLPSSYLPGSIFVESTNFDRTFMSAQSFLAGLYPLGTGPTLPHSMTPALPGAQQVIPIHRIPEAQDPTFIPDLNPKYGALLEKYIYSTPEWINKTNQLKTNFPAWSKALGVQITQLYQLPGDALYIRKLYRIPLPLGLSSQDADKIMATSQWVVATTFRNPEIGKATGGDLLKIIGNHLKEASEANHPTDQKTPDQNLKYILLSAHDSTLLSLMSAMRAPLDGTPPYASDLNFELFENNPTQTADKPSYEIQVKFNGKPVVIPGCIQLMGHPSNRCSLPEFLAVSPK